MEGAGLKVDAGFFNQRDHEFPDSVGRVDGDAIGAADFGFFAGGGDVGYGKIAVTRHVASAVKSKSQNGYCIIAVRKIQI